MKGIVLFALLAGTAAPALAKPASDRPENGDPKRVICRTQDALGSRLRREKVCMTAQQWAETRLDDRRNLERVQGGGWKSN